MCCHAHREEDSRPRQSTVVRSFRFLKEFGDAVVIEPRFQAERKRRHLEGFARLRLDSGGQPEPQQPVDRRLEGATGAPDLLLHEAGNVVVNGESGAHIMMLCHEAS